MKKSRLLQLLESEELRHLAMAANIHRFQAEHEEVAEAISIAIALVNRTSMAAIEAIEVEP